MANLIDKDILKKDIYFKICNKCKGPVDSTLDDCNCIIKKVIVVIDSQDIDEKELNNG